MSAPCMLHIKNTFFDRRPVATVAREITDRNNEIALGEILNFQDILAKLSDIFRHIWEI